ncbi:hypothetical protein [Adlercreutzia sp. ZJ138]|uniref:hypothetical protein n=1 Tax=Adlercreutzia sp. ZJ138 TaxID=2709405 RepID=UPI0013ED4B0E|nr:hypothetical protein [Adlercreutzia sp. ZJ138]
MFEQDYLMRLITQFFAAIARSMRVSTDERDPKRAAESLETAIGEATDIDAAVLLSLAPESIAAVMKVSGVDPQVTGYVARGLLLEARYLCEAGDHALAAVRSGQAYAIAEAYGFELGENSVNELIDEACGAEE